MSDPKDPQEPNFDPYMNQCHAEQRVAQTSKEEDVGNTSNTPT